MCPRSNPINLFRLYNILCRYTNQRGGLGCMGTLVRQFFNWGYFSVKKNFAPFPGSLSAQISFRYGHLEETSVTSISNG